MKSSLLNKPVAQVKIIDDSLRNIQNVPEKLKKNSYLWKESKAIWLQRCSICHGKNGNLENVAVTNVIPRKFSTIGMSIGFLFGGDKMRKGIFRKIRDGVKNKNRIVTMPAWNQVLSFEQIWGLTFYIEEL